MGVTLGGSGVTVGGSVRQSEISIALQALSTCNDEIEQQIGLLGEIISRVSRPEDEGKMGREPDPQHPIVPMVTPIGRDLALVRDRMRQHVDRLCDMRRRLEL